MRSEYDFSKAELKPYIIISIIFFFVSTVIFNEQVIDAVSAYWYKIEYDNSYGYIWGGFLAVQTFKYDILIGIEGIGA
jgi:hypothetical protein